MKDRIPTYPGRVTLTPVSGQANTYDLVRADEPTQAGTPLNKASLLTDAVANTIKTLAGEATVPSTPNEALNMLSEAIAAGVKMAFGTYVGTGTYGSSNPTSLTFDFEPKILWVAGAYLNMQGPYSYYYGTLNDAFFVMRGATSTSTGDAGNGVSLTWSGNTVSWYSGAAAAQLNTSGKTYTYFAIG